MVYLKVKGIIFIIIKMFIKVNGKMVKKMDKGKCFIKMVVNLLVILLMIRKREKEFIYQKKVLN